jgi:alpha-amylase
VFSSFAFTAYDQPPPSDHDGFVTPVTCGTTWICEHRTMAAMVGFHNATHADPTVSNWWSDGANAIAFSRGPAGAAAGWIAINAGDSPSAQTFKTGLKAGSYCDLIHGKSDGGTCDGPTVTVTADGTAQVTVPAHDAVAIDLPSRVG